MDPVKKPKGSFPEKLSKKQRKKRAARLNALKRGLPASPYVAKAARVGADFPSVSGSGLMSSAAENRRLGHGPNDACNLPRHYPLPKKSTPSRQRKLALYHLLKDLHPVVRRAFKPYPPLVQILAKIAISGASWKTDVAFRAFNLEHLKNSNYLELVDKFRPMISKLVQSADESGPYDDPGDDYFSDEGSFDYNFDPEPNFDFPASGSSGGNDGRNFLDNSTVVESLAKLSSYIGILKQQGKFSAKSGPFPDVGPSANSVRGQSTPISGGFISSSGPSQRDKPMVYENSRFGNVQFDSGQSVPVRFVSWRQFDSGQSVSGRQFDSGQSVSGRQFDSGQSVSGRQFDSGQSVPGRFDSQTATGQFSGGRSGGRQFDDGRSVPRQFDTAGLGPSQFNDGSGPGQFNDGRSGPRQFNDSVEPGQFNDGSGPGQFNDGFGPGQFNDGLGPGQFNDGLGPGQFNDGMGSDQFNDGSGPSHFNDGFEPDQLNDGRVGQRQFNDGQSVPRQLDAAMAELRQHIAGRSDGRQFNRMPEPRQSKAGRPGACHFADQPAAPDRRDHRSCAERSKDWRLSRYHESADTDKDQSGNGCWEIVDPSAGRPVPYKGPVSAFVYPRIGVTEAASARRLSRTEAEMVELALFKRITAKDRVRCHGVYRECGAVIFVCDDDSSARWLVKTVPFLLPWAGAILKAEPWCKRLNSTELLFQLPPILSNMPWTTFCEKLQLQNGQLSTASWSLIVEEDTVRVCSIDRKSLNDLAALDFKAFLSFFQIEFKLISEALT